MRRGQAFEDWFKAQERLLHEEAQLAGLLDHSSTVGTAREFVIKRVLRAILPPLVHIGSGVVVDAYGNCSKQIDIVLYDPRFPVMEFDEGIGRYPIEGVICTIEVKSDLKGKEFIAALDNCHSVHELSIAVPPQGSLRKKAEGFCKELPDMPMREALIKAGCEFYPATYVVAFRGVGAKAMRNTVEKWYGNLEHQTLKILENEESLAGVVPALPRVIVSGKNVGAAHDGWFRYVLHDDQAQQRLDDEHGPRGRVMMFTLAAHSPLWWLASHILHTTSNRLKMVHGTTGMRYRVDHYIEPPENLAAGQLYEVCSSIQDFS